MIAVIPSYNPDEHLYKVIKELHEETDARLIVVDDGTDVERKYFFVCLSKADVLLTHHKNLGKGAAMKTALQYVWEHYQDEEAVIFLDGDGQHRIEDIKRVIAASGENPDKVIFGSRQFPKDIPWKSKIGNKLTNDFLYLTTGRKLTDTQTGLRVIPGSLIQTFSELSGEKYEYEMNMLVYLLRTKAEIVEVPIEAVYENNENKTTHFRPIKDTLRIHFMIFRPLLVALLTIAVDYYISLLYIFKGRLQGGPALLLSNVVIGCIVSEFYYMLNNKDIYIKGAPKGRTTVKFYAATAAILASMTGLYYILLCLLHIPAPFAKLITEVVSFILVFLIQRIKLI